MSSEYADNCSTSTETGDTDLSPDESANSGNSMRSLLKQHDQEDKSGDCVDIECSELATQVCVMSCSDSESKDEGHKKSFCCNTICQSVWGCMLLLLGVASFLYTPLDVMLREKLNMRPGMPPYEWWADPPDEVLLSMYVFNVTNHERFVSGLDQKLNYEEIGPIVYLEKLRHSNISFNENSTMTYTANRVAIFLPNMNTIDLNSTLIMPNLAVLGMASYLHSAPYFIRTAYKYLVRSHNSKFFIKKTIYEYLWEYHEPVLKTTGHIAPGLVPVTNMGMLSRIYSSFTDEVTVKVGPRWGHDSFFQITRFHGQPQIPGFDPDKCPDRLYGSTEGVMYKQYLRKTDVLLYWRTSVCKLMPLYFDKEITLNNVPVWRFNLSESIYERLTNTTDCYDTTPSLPAGVSDASKCYYDFPMVVSYPHFYTGSPPKDYYVTGLTPDHTKHNSYVIVEPLTGTPFHSVARMQSNLRVHDLSGFSPEYDQFSNLVLPLFWAEYNQQGLPYHIRTTIYFMVVVLPPLSTVISTLALILGFYLVIKPIYVQRVRYSSLSNALPHKNGKINAIAKNKILSYEKEKFLKKPS